MTQTRQANSDNQITGISNTTGTPWAQPATGQTYYDANGNMITTPQPGNESDGLTCTYDAWNRLVKVTDGSSISISYAYDGLGRLITRTDNNATATQSATTDYYYAGQQMLESDQRPPVSPSGGSQYTTEQYVWSARYVDSPIESDTTTYSYSTASSTWTAGTPSRLYYLTDANNNVTAVTNSSGVVQERYSYDAYRRVTMYNGPTSPGGDWSDPHTVSTQGTTRLFAGEQQDPTTGLDYDRARWYNPSTGGFISQDPAQSDPNLYRYAGNDPTGEVDPSGLKLVNRADRCAQQRSGDGGAQTRQQVMAQRIVEHAEFVYRCAKLVQSRRRKSISGLRTPTLTK